MTSTYKRRKLPVVDHNLQGHFLINSLIYAFVLLLLLLSVFLIPDIVALDDYTQSAQARGMIADRLNDVHSWIWFIVIGLLCLFAVHAFRSFLRVIGPLYRMREALDRMTRLELNFDVNLRQGDLLELEAEKFNGLIAELNTRIGRLQRSADTVYADLESLRSKDLPESLGQDLARLQTDLGSLKSELRQFKVSDENSAKSD